MEAGNSNLDLEKAASHVAPKPLEKKDPNLVVETSSEHTSTEADKEKGLQEPVIESTIEPGDEEHEYPSTKKLIPLMGSVYIAFFLVSLVRYPPTQLSFTA